MDFITIKSYNPPTVMLLLNFITFLNHICFIISLTFVWKWNSKSVMSDSLWPHGLYCPWNSPDQNTGVQGIFPTQGFKHMSPALQVDSLPAEPPGKPKNTGVGSLSLLQWIFLTQELNQGLLHCRRILYQLSYQGTYAKNVYRMKNRNSFICINPICVSQ